MAALLILLLVLNRRQELRQGCLPGWNRKAGCFRLRQAHHGVMRPVRLLRVFRRGNRGDFDRLLLQNFPGKFVPGAAAIIG